MTRPLLALAVVGTLALPVHALPIEEFDSLSRDDRTEYMNDLVDASLRALYRDELYDDYTALRTLFGRDTPGSLRIPQGMITFAEKIEGLRGLVDQTGRRAEVEDAFAATLQENGIVPPKALMSLLEPGGSSPR